MNELDGLYQSSLSPFPEYPLPSFEVAKDMTLDEMEEEVVRLSSQRDAYLERGDTARATELSAVIAELEEQIEDMEDFEESAGPGL